MARSIFRVFIALGAPVILYSPTTGLAQERLIEEVVVTAQRREQSLQDTAVAVTAVSGDDLAANGIIDINRLEVLAPGLQLGLSGNDPRPAMRGARTQQVEANDVAVAFYTDGLYRPRHGQALAGFVDVNRVEVLRGPQGTLFGRNSLGGLIHVISNRPEYDTTDFGVALTAGDYSQMRGEAYANVAFSDNAALRIAGVKEERDPYVGNDAIGDRGGLKDADMSYLRAQFAFTPSDTMEITLRGEVWEDDSNGNGDFGYKVLGIPVNLATGNTNGTTGVLRPRIGRSTECAGTCGRFGAGLDETSTGGGNTAVPTISDPYTISRNTLPARDVEETTFAADLEWGLNFADLKITLATMDYEELRLADADLSAFNTLRAGNDIASETTSQEIQLTSNGDGALEWVVGAYLFQEDLDNAFLWQDISSVANNVPVAPLNAWASWMNQIRLETDSSAFYAQGTYSLTDTFRATAGVRYTKDERDWDIYGQNPDDLSTPSFTVLEVPNAGEEWSKTTWKLGVEYDVSETSFVYANVSTGFLAGNAQGAFSGAGSYDEQLVTAYEAGSKLLLADGTLVLNTSLYYNDFEDLLSTRFQDTGGTTLAFSDNAGEIQALGLEIEADWAPTDELRLGSRVALQNAEYGNFVTPNVFQEGGETINGVDNLFDLDGEQVQMSPDVTVTLLGSYDILMDSGWLLRPAVTFYYSDEYRADDALFFFAEQESFTKTDLSLSLFPPDQRWNIRAFINNIEDEATLTKVTRYGGDVAIADYAAPQTWGFAVRYNF